MLMVPEASVVVAENLEATLHETSAYPMQSGSSAVFSTAERSFVAGTEAAKWK